jgi:methenyltetrahydrofolate cyclohydrolase
MMDVWAENEGREEFASTPQAALQQDLPRGLQLGKRFMETGELTIGNFLDALAAKQSTPGGGGAAALTGSQAAALLCMVANFTLGAKKYADVHEEMSGYLAQADALRLKLLTLADDDVAAFSGVSACYAMPKESDAEKAARTAALQTALKEAARVPLVAAKSALAVMKLSEPVAAKGNSNVVSDAAVALYLAEAALRASIVNVNINLKFIKDEPFVESYTTARNELLAAAVTAAEAGKMACRQVLEIEL